MKLYKNIQHSTVDSSLESEKEHLLSVTMTPFLEWFKKSIIDVSQVTSVQRVIRGVDVTTGLLASAVVAPLGYEFGKIVSDAAGIKDLETQKAIAYYFSATATGSASILVARISNSVLEKLIIPLSKENIALMRKERGCYDYFKLLMKVFLWSSAALSAVPESYLAYQYFKAPMGLWSLIFAAADMQALTLKNGWAVGNISNQFYSSIRSKILTKLTKNEISTVRKMRLNLENQLKKSMEIISKLSDKDINNIFNTLFSKDKNNTIDIEKYAENVNLSRVRELFHLSSTHSVEATKKSTVRTLFGYLGGAIGIAGAYPFYPIAKEATINCLETFGVHEKETQEFFGHMVGLSAYTARSALSAYATKDSFERFYTWFSNLPSKVRSITNCCRQASAISPEAFVDSPTFNARSYLHSGFTLLGTLLSLSGGAPRAVMANKSLETSTYYGQMLIVCSFLGAFATNFWAVQGLIDDSFSGVAHRTRLLEAISKILKLLPDMSDEHILVLHKEIFPSEIKMTF